MNKIQVKLLHYTPLDICIKAIRTCYGSESKNIENDFQLIRNIIKNDHTSTIEHIVFTFHIKGISRLCLIELTRHRIASYSVKSTRYTLDELHIEDFVNPFVEEDENHFRYEIFIDEFLYGFKNYSNDYKKDIKKYFILESLRTELIMTINARSLRNLFKLRMSNRAHFEIRHLANLMYNEIPITHRILFEDIVKSNNNLED